MVSRAPIISFSGSNFYLSNFYPCTLRFLGRTYQSSEHVYQAEKVRRYGATIMDTVRLAPTPSQAKKIANSYEAPSNWHETKVDIMADILRVKFQHRHPHGEVNRRARWLMNTGDVDLIEGNNWGDTFWGQCPLGNGENMLGKLLMKVRSELRASQGK